MDRGPDDPSGRDHTADQFEAIVAGWRREGVVPAWPGDERPPAEPPRTPPVAMPAVPLFQPATADAETDQLEHYVPPEPPPLPRLGPPAVVGFSLLALGLILVTVPGLVGVPNLYGLPLGLLVLAAGLGWLVLRLWPDSASAMDRDDDPDGGAIL